MVWCLFFNGYFNLVVFRNIKVASEAKKVVDLNSLFFGALAVFSLLVFFYLGRFKASKSQTERDNRPKWNKGIREYKGCLVKALILLGVIIILNYLLF